LIEKNPEIFRKCRIRVTAGDKDGMTLVRVEEIAEHAQKDASGGK
jgi:hypothetical protein